MGRVIRPRKKSGQENLVKRIHLKRLSTSTDENEATSPKISLSRRAIRFLAMLPGRQFLSSNNILVSLGASDSRLTLEILHSDLQRSRHKDLPNIKMTIPYFSTPEYILRFVYPMQRTIYARTLHDLETAASLTVADVVKLPSGKQPLLGKILIRASLVARALSESNGSLSIGVGEKTFVLEAGVNLRSTQVTFRSDLCSLILRTGPQTQDKNVKILLSTIPSMKPSEVLNMVRMGLLGLEKRLLDK